jgi:hypothetical protein
MLFVEMSPEDAIFVSIHIENAQFPPAVFLNNIKNITHF